MLTEREAWLFLAVRWSEAKSSEELVCRHTARWTVNGREQGSGLCPCVDHLM